MNEWLLKMKDQLKSNTITFGCRRSVLEIKRLRTRGSVCAMLNSPMLRRNDRPLFTGFQ